MRQFFALIYPVTNVPGSDSVTFDFDGIRTNNQQMPQKPVFLVLGTKITVEI